MVAEDVQGRVTKKVCLACNREFTGIVAACPHDGTVLIPLAQDQLVGTKLADRYEILSVIGHGGMGVVYKARHELMDRIVAIKMLLSQLISDSMSVKRFQQEAKAASRLKHPNVITLYDFGVSPTGQPYLVMDYLEGVSLSEVIKKEGQIGVERAIRILAQACDALDHAHHQGVIHRDLKPGNIMLVTTADEKDFVKVVDFGVAKLMPWAGDSESQRLTQTGEVCGSPVYMSPEQCMGQKLDSRSDIYSMGVVLYEGLTGKLPLLGKTMVDTMSKHISEMPPSFGEVRPDLYIPERLEAVVFRALQKEPDDRHQTMAELSQDLQFAIPKPGKSQVLRTVEISTQTKSTQKAPTGSKTLISKEVPKSGAGAAAKTAGPPKAMLAVVALVVALAAAAGGWFLLNSNKTAQEPKSTTQPPPAVVPAPTQTSTEPAKPPARSQPVDKPRVKAEPPVTPPSNPAAEAPSQSEPTVIPRPAPSTVVSPPRPTPAPAPRKRPTIRPAAAAPAPVGNPFDDLKSERSY